jgi:hypothetical protein
MRPRDLSPYNTPSNSCEKAARVFSHLQQHTTQILRPIRARSEPGGASPAQESSEGGGERVHTRRPRASERPASPHPSVGLALDVKLACSGVRAGCMLRWGLQRRAAAAQGACIGAAGCSQRSGRHQGSLQRWTLSGEPRRSRALLQLRCLRLAAAPPMLSAMTALAANSSSAAMQRRKARDPSAAAQHRPQRHPSPWPTR